MFCAIFFIKIARSYLFTSALCFPLSSLLLPSIPVSASIYLRFCILLFLSLLPSILAPSQICFSTPQIYQSPFFSHDFSLPRHTLFAMKPCIASSFPVICLCFVQRHTFSG